MVYKKGPPYKVRPVEEICEDIREAGKAYGKKVKSVFFPADSQRTKYRVAFSIDFFGFE